MNSANSDNILQLEKAQSLTSLMWDSFCQHRAAVVGLIILLFFSALAILAPWVASLTGLSMEKQNPMHRYLPMGSVVEWSFAEKENSLELYLQNHSAEASKLAAWKSSPSTDFLHEWLQQESSVEILSKLPAGVAPAFEKMLASFQTKHWLGTDELGRDVLMRLIYGTRVSMGVALAVTLASAFLGLMIGSFSGFYGGWIDHVLMRITDALLALPLLPVLIVVSAMDVNKISWLQNIFPEDSIVIGKLLFVMTLFSWMSVARLVRGTVLSLREREFILATRTLGATDLTLIFRHILPNVIGPMLVSITLGVGESILFESALSFLGMGIQQPTPSWGNMLTNAQELISEAPHLAVLPGLLILMVTMSFNYLGDGLHQAVDPKSMKR